jgi:hypothetical protein
MAHAAPLPGLAPFVIHPGLLEFGISFSWVSLFSNSAGSASSRASSSFAIICHATGEEEESSSLLIVGCA